MCHPTNIDRSFIVVYTIKKDTNGSLENVIEIELSIHTHTSMHFWYPNNKNEEITNLILH